VSFISTWFNSSEALAALTAKCHGARSASGPQPYDPFLLANPARVCESKGVFSFGERLRSKESQFHHLS
jgi:hypothetical protein